MICKVSSLADTIDSDFFEFAGVKETMPMVSLADLKHWAIEGVKEQTKIIESFKGKFLEGRGCPMDEKTSIAVIIKHFLIDKFELKDEDLK